jgi:hypothetical protein
LGKDIAPAFGPGVSGLSAATLRSQAGVASGTTLSAASDFLHLATKPEEQTQLNQLSSRRGSEASNLCRFVSTFFRSASDVILSPQDIGDVQVLL